MPFVAIVSIQDLLVTHTYEADAPIQYGGPWGDPTSHTHIVVPDNLDPECLTAICNDETGEIELRTDPEKTMAKRGRMMQQIRTQRNQRLAETDWTRIDDAPLTDAQREDWSTYRQALRDLPDSLTDDEIMRLDAIQWPSKPQ